jgi:aldehyde dehydrogenase (NAD+)
MNEILTSLGIEQQNLGSFNGDWFANGKSLTSYSPIDGKPIANVTLTTKEDYEKIVQAASEAFKEWRMVPAPVRGEVVRQIGLELREHKDALGKLVTLEMGKSIQEGWGEVQEMIDICDFATGLSRQLYGLTMHSERAKHRMYEQWHPLGIVGVISAFNFPVAVWSWNIAIALVCGNTTIWKPSTKTPLTAIASIKIAQKVLERNGYPGAICSLMIGRGSEVGDVLSDDKRIPLVSYTGSTKIGKRISERMGKRLGKTIMELGGNNCVIVSQHANQDIALKSIFFGAVGTAGQRCTSTRRIIIHESIYDSFLGKLLDYYKKVSIGNPLEEQYIMGPMIDTAAVDMMMNAIEQLRKEGGKLLYGGEKLTMEGGCYVTPAIAEADNRYDIVQEETFAPILYVMKYNHLEEAIAMQNDVPQGLSSAIITDNMIEAEKYLSHAGSDCGIANVNIGTSGAEIGGAFGGEKDTGGGRESGSDSWKQYMRRQTNTINWSEGIALAQGIKFGDE